MTPLPDLREQRRFVEDELTGATIERAIAGDPANSVELHVRTRRGALIRLGAMVFAGVLEPSVVDVAPPALHPIVNRDLGDESDRA